MTGFVLILTVVTSYGAVTTQSESGFSSYRDCAVHAIAWADSQRDLNPGADVKWQCEAH